MKKNQFALFLISPIGKAVIIIFFAIIIYGLIVAGMASNNMVILGITIFLCAYFGWRALNKITPDIFVIMSINAWAIYFLVKGLLSIFIGAFVAPFQIGKMLCGFISDSVREDGQ
ncbi:MAG: hypothetical protein E7644_03980 [Ruminococcaceae bacterium]|nr:hypothetical protein [Oscillospiraceae bacterium]